MPYRLSWFVEKRITFLEYNGEITPKELAESEAANTRYLEQAMPELGKGLPLVHILVDTTRVTKMPTNLGQLRKIIHTNTDARVGWIVTVTPNPLLRFVSSVIVQLVGQRMRQFETLTEAVAFLQEIDETLPKLTVPGTHNSPV